MTKTMTADEDAQSFYGRWASLYDLLARRTPGIVSLRRRAAMACRLEPGDTVVEMGCGTGANLPFLREQVGPEGSVIGIDFTAPVLERAHRLTEGHENVHVVRGDATTTPIDGPIDAILATFVVGMLDDPAGAVDDWCDLLAPGGHLVLVNAARSDAWYGPPVNVLFRAVVVLSTPPTTTLRYDDDLTARLDRRIRTAHDRLRDRSSAVAHETSVGGVVRLTGGRID
ncbi:class I SAM-dependent methyltransferase [Natronosalvus vescus]|uniref:class I SAM-dependent methyltransferase n=1 Tax=Natronosalvus vescus TaxID=2953881 RepID=UPI002091D61E|nr:methyltransferase domain-containing protein [Natronosalvus vescus]